jgi:hypothetical protein
MCFGSGLILRLESWEILLTEDKCILGHRVLQASFSAHWVQVEFIFFRNTLVLLNVTFEE